MNESYKKKYLKYKNKYHNIKGGSLGSSLGIGSFALLILLITIIYFYNKNKTTTTTQTDCTDNFVTSLFLEQFLKNTNNGLNPPSEDDIKLLEKHLMYQQNKEKTITQSVNNNIKKLLNLKNR